MTRTLVMRPRARKYQTMKAVTHVYSSRKIDYYDYERETSLRDEDPLLWHCMEYYGCSHLEMRCGNIVKKAWRDKHGNIVVRYAQIEK